MFATVVEGLATVGLCEGCPRRRRKAVRPRPRIGAGAQPHACIRSFPGVRHLPHRPLPRQGSGREPALFPVRQFLPRTDLEPQLRRQRADHDGRGFRRAGPRRLLREVGAIRDVMQNHLLQVMALLAMEPRSARAPTPCSDEKLRVFRAMRPLHRERRRARPVRRLPRRAGRRARLAGRDLLRPCGCISTRGAGRACRSTSAPASACRSRHRSDRAAQAAAASGSSTTPAPRPRRTTSASVCSRMSSIALGARVKTPGRGHGRRADASSSCIDDPCEDMSPTSGCSATRWPATRRCSRRQRRRRGGVARRRSDPRRRHAGRAYAAGQLGTRGAATRSIAGDGGWHDPAAGRGRAVTTRRSTSYSCRRRQHAARQRPRHRRPARPPRARVRRRQPRPLLGDLRGAARRARLCRLPRRACSATALERSARSAHAAADVVASSSTIRSPTGSIRARSTRSRISRRSGPTVILSDGDVVFQPRKVAALGAVGRGRGPRPDLHPQGADARRRRAALSGAALRHGRRQAAHPDGDEEASGASA